jgi:hypothetical protein
VLSENTTQALQVPVLTVSLGTTALEQLEIMKSSHVLQAITVRQLLQLQLPALQENIILTGKRLIHLPAVLVQMVIIHSKERLIVLYVLQVVTVQAAQRAVVLQELITSE